jgi:hypothetical protein
MATSWRTGSQHLNQAARTTACSRSTSGPVARFPIGVPDPVIGCRSGRHLPTHQAGTTQAGLVQHVVVVRWQRGSGPGPGRPARRPDRDPAPPGRARSMLGRRRAATTGTPCVTTLPQGTWAPWTDRDGQGQAPPEPVPELGGMVPVPAMGIVLAVGGRPAMHQDVKRAVPVAAAPIHEGAARCSSRPSARRRPGAGAAAKRATEPRVGPPHYAPASPMGRTPRAGHGARTRQRPRPTAVNPDGRLRAGSWPAGGPGRAG